MYVLKLLNLFLCQNKRAVVNFQASFDQRNDFIQQEQFFLFTDSSDVKCKLFLNIFDLSDFDYISMYFVIFKLKLKV